MNARRSPEPPPNESADSAAEREREAWLRAAGQLHQVQADAEPEVPPLTDADLDRLTAAALDALRTAPPATPTVRPEPGDAPRTAPPATPTVRPEPGDAPPGAEVVPLRTRWRRPAWRLGAIPFALAAGAAFFLLRPAPPLAPVLPTYEPLVLEGGARPLRSGEPNPSGPVVLERGTRFDFALRPRTAVPNGTGPGAVRGFIVRAEQVTAWKLPYRLDGGGAVRVTGRTGEDLPHDAGAALLVVTLGPDAPEGEALRLALGVAHEAAGPGWRAYGFPVEMR
ncbi:hypothetical protein L6V77_14200 [Myxococcota bacterium]|nr:hypothetical protein [Myxococcota bacterium]